MAKRYGRYDNQTRRSKVQLSLTTFKESCLDMIFG
jgi:hypothetical protein